jgi:O-antigen/teichoic acid export membrane protein
MIKNISKICSFLLLFILAILALNEFKIMNYSEDLKKIFYFLALILIMFSSVTTLLTNKSGFFKFVSVIIMLSLIVGGIMSILKSGLNLSLYVCVVLTIVYSLVDMFYKAA